MKIDNVWLYSVIKIQTSLSDLATMFVGCSVFLIFKRAIANFLSYEKFLLIQQVKLNEILLSSY